MEQNQATQLLADPISSSFERLRNRPATQRVILSAFSRMQRGRLLLQLPDGENLIFGSDHPGNEVHAEIRILNNDFFKRCILFGAIGFAESFMDGEWETESITHVIAWFLLNSENSTVLDSSSKKTGLIDFFHFANRLFHLTRSNTRANSRRNIAEHYDLSNEFFSLWLDPSMTYSSGYFKNGTETLEESQFQKYDKLCRSLQIGPDDHVLEIGCGWGGFALHAVKQYGCRVTGITISEKQYEMATKRVAEAGLQDRIQIVIKDYRDLEGQYDKIASIEMLEAVGDKYLETYFGKCAQVLKKDGLLGLQVITCPDSRYEQLRKGVDFIQKHIFPGSLLLSLARILKAIGRTSSLSVHKIDDMGEHYAKTLHLWNQRFEAAKPQVKALGFDERFLRKWSYYLCYCEAAFAMREISVAQWVFTRPNNPRLAAPLSYTT